jgi:hypothetical protein
MQVQEACPRACSICGLDANHPRRRKAAAAAPDSCEDKGYWGRPCKDFDICDEGCSNRFCNPEHTENWGLRVSCAKSCGQCGSAHDVHFDAAVSNAEALGEPCDGRRDGAASCSLQRPILGHVSSRTQASAPTEASCLQRTPGPLSASASAASTHG